MVKNFRDLEGLRNTFHTISLIIRQKYNEAFEAYELANAKENTDGKYKQKIQSLKDSINNVNSSIREYRRLEELINLGGVQVTYNDPIAELSNKVSNYNNELNTIDESIQREVEKINNAEFIYSNSGITSSEIESIYRISDAATNNTYELNNLIREFINGKAANEEVILAVTALSLACVNYNLMPETLDAALCKFNTLEKLRWECGFSDESSDLTRFGALLVQYSLSEYVRKNANEKYWEDENYQKALVILEKSLPDYNPNELLLDMLDSTIIENFSDAQVEQYFRGYLSQLQNGYEIFSGVAGLSIAYIIRRGLNDEKKLSKLLDGFVLESNVSIIRDNGGSVCSGRYNYEDAKEYFTAAIHNCFEKRLQSTKAYTDALNKYIEKFNKVRPIKFGTNWRSANANWFAFLNLGLFYKGYNSVIKGDSPVCVNDLCKKIVDAALSGNAENSIIETLKLQLGYTLDDKSSLFDLNDVKKIEVPEAKSNQMPVNKEPVIKPTNNRPTNSKPTEKMADKPKSNGGLKKVAGFAAVAVMLVVALIIANNFRDRSGKLEDLVASANEEIESVLGGGLEEKSDTDSNATAYLQGIEGLFAKEGCVEFAEDIGDYDREDQIRNFIIYKYRENVSALTPNATSEFSYEIMNEGSEGEEYIIINSYDGTAENVNIPNSIEGKAVIQLADNAFRGNIFLKSVILPNSIMYIGDAAFMECGKLENVITSANVVSYGSDCFGECKNLKSFGFIDDNGNITDAPKVSPKYIGTSAFRSCEGLEEILLPGNTFSDVCIDTYAFDSCTGLKSACLPVVADRLSDSAFKNDAELSELHFSRDIVKGEAYVELNMRSVGDSAFSGCSSITEVRLLENCRSIESSAFSDCSKLSEVKWNENRVENGNVVGYASFTRTGLEKVELPGSYVSVDAFAFAECPNLKSFALHRTGGNKVEQSVDLQGADSCEALSEVFIPITSEVYNIPFTDDDGVAIYTDSEMVKEYAANNNLNIREWNE